MAKATYRPVTQAEIALLTGNGCAAEDWSRVCVCEGCDLTTVTDVTFRGEVRVGRLVGSIEAPDGVARNSGISRARLDNVDVGNGCAISNVHGWLSCLDIGEGAVLENVGTIACKDGTAFGNGHEIPVLNEGGGRELRITSVTSAQIAYLTVLYRDKPELVKALNVLVDRFCDQARSNRAPVGRAAVVMNCNEIINVRIGDFATVKGALSLRNGTVDSSKEMRTVVGQGVVAEDFIFQKGSRVEDGAIVAASLIGEGTRIGKQFSAEGSVFFANSEGFHSEACSVFAGPYSVTHHRSTLLIAALVSFFNAGSGTNQSNHMYKLGPVHQGILERGCKTGSHSYLLWPSRIGAFTAVIGKHYANFDTSEFPFSYISEENGRSTLVPAMNYFTVGTFRDGEKWPARDRRGTGQPMDLITFDVLSPFTAQRMINAVEILSRLYAQSGKDQEYVSYKGIHIKRLLLRTCSRYYRLVLDKYFGDVLLRRIGTGSSGSIRDVLKIETAGEDGRGDWIDVCGLICTRSRINRLISGISEGRFKDISELHDAFRQIHGSYDADEWNWLMANYRGLTGRDLTKESNADLREFVVRWKKSSLKLVKMVANDASKEFEGGTRIGFGIDGNADADFDAVRGTLQDNEFVKKLERDMEEIGRKCVLACSLLG